jgi:flavin reductase (DIM6/NTAB) family NADH-FMN oxidoreductase RutF
VTNDLLESTRGCIDACNIAFGDRGGEVALELVERRCHPTSSITSVSRRPALISVCLANRSRTLGLVEAARSFALSLLAADQEDVAKRFAAKERATGRAQFAGVPHHLSAFGPIIDTAAAALGCRVHALHSCGDHHIVVGQVELARGSGRRPLLRHDGSYH